MNTRIEYIDFAKGYAIFTIVCYHVLQRADLSPLWQQAIVFGGTGIHLFFLLSGFGLGLSQFSGTPLQLYQRRLTRVWLPYVLALTISLLAAVFFGLFPDRFDAWLAGAGLYQMFSERYIESFGGHFWFISTIIQFYIAYPALRWIKNRLSESFKLSESSLLSGDRLFFLLSLVVSVAWWLLVFFFGKRPSAGLEQLLFAVFVGVCVGDGAGGACQPHPQPLPRGEGRRREHRRTF